MPAPISRTTAARKNAKPFRISNVNANVNVSRNDGTGTGTGNRTNNIKKKTSSAAASGKKSSNSSSKRTTRTTGMVVALAKNMNKNIKKATRTTEDSIMITTTAPKVRRGNKPKDQEEVSKSIEVLGNANRNANRDVRHSSIPLVVEVSNMSVTMDNDDDNDNDDPLDSLPNLSATSLDESHSQSRSDNQRDTVNDDGNKNDRRNDGNNGNGDGSTVFSFSKLYGSENENGNGNDDDNEDLIDDIISRLTDVVASESNNGNTNNNNGSRRPSKHDHDHDNGNESHIQQSISQLNQAAMAQIKILHQKLQIQTNTKLELIDQICNLQKSLEQTLDRGHQKSSSTLTGHRRHHCNDDDHDHVHMTMLIEENNRLKNHSEALNRNYRHDMRDIMHRLRKMDEELENRDERIRVLEVEVQSVRSENTMSAMMNSTNFSASAKNNVSASRNKYGSGNATNIRYVSGRGSGSYSGGDSGNRVRTSHNQNGDGLNDLAVTGSSGVENLQRRHRMEGQGREREQEGGTGEYEELDFVKRGGGSFLGGSFKNEQGDSVTFV